MFLFFGMILEIASDLPLEETIEQCEGEGLLSRENESHSDPELHLGPNLEFERDL